MDEVIVIVVEGGCVTDVHGLPKGWSYLLNDMDLEGDFVNEEECREQNIHLLSVDDDGYCNRCGDQTGLASSSDYTVIVTVEGGVVVEVDGLPEGFTYEVDDLD